MVIGWQNWSISGHIWVEGGSIWPEGALGSHDESIEASRCQKGPQGANNNLLLNGPECGENGQEGTKELKGVKVAIGCEIGVKRTLY